MSCSIHLGNYILVVQPPTANPNPTSSARGTSPNQSSENPLQKKKKQVNTSIMGMGSGGTTNNQPIRGAVLNTAEHNIGGLGALDFEISWLKFLRDAEDEYQKRLTRNDKQQPLSIFEVNVDLFENYLLKVSGRALAATQHLNLNLTSAMGSDLKIFDTQHPEEPNEEEVEFENEASIQKRRNQRHLRRIKKRRITASFHDHNKSLIDQQSMMTPGKDSSPVIIDEQIQQTPELPPKKGPKVVYRDSLNERDDDEEEAENGGEQYPIEEEDESHEDFARDETIQVPTMVQENKNFVQQIPSFDKNLHANELPIQQEATNFNNDDLKGGQKYLSQTIDEVAINQTQNIITKSQISYREYKISQLHPESVIKTEEDNNPEPAKVMIGDQSIDANFEDNGDPGAGGIQYEDQDEINEDDIEGHNPFKARSGSIIGKNSIISQPSAMRSPNGTYQNIVSQLYSSQIQEGTENDENQADHRSTFEKIAILNQEDQNYVQQPSEFQNEEQNNNEGILHTAKAKDEPSIIQQETDQATPIQTEHPASLQHNLIEISKQPEIQPEIIPATLPISPLIKQQEVAIENGAQLAVEPEVILRFEVAVGTTPPNQSFLESNSLKDNQPIENNIQERSLLAQDTLNVSPVRQVVEQAVGGSTPLEQTFEKELEFVNGQPKLEVSVGVGSDMINEDEIDQGEYYANGVHAQSILSDNTKQSRLEVTLTAEPDKPIMLEVRGGEKQFLISALTKHIYEILTQPHKLQMLRENDQDQEQPDLSQGQIQDQSIRSVKLNKNINLKLKSLKKTLKQTNLPVLKAAKNEASRNDLSNNLQQNVITIEEYENSRQEESQNKQNLPSIKPSQLNSVNASQNRKMRQGISSRTSSGMALSPLTNSVMDDPSREIVVKRIGAGTANGPKPAIENAYNNRRTDRDQFRYDQISKRTTEEAYADAKIREESRLTHVFESETSIFGRETGIIKKNSQSQIRQGRRDLSEKASILTREPTDSKRDIMLPSRPETANFNPNGQFQELPPINIRSSQVNIHHHSQTPKNGSQDMIISNSQYSRRTRRAITPEGQTGGDQHHEIINSGPAHEIDQFSLPPLQPTIPNQNFNSSEIGEDQYYIQGQDQIINQDSYDDIKGPHIAYYDPFQNTAGSTMGYDHQPLVFDQNGYYTSSNGFADGYPIDQDQNSPQGEYILAEGFPMMINNQQQATQGVRRIVGSKIRDKQIYEFSRNTPGGLNQQSVGGGQSNFITRSTLQNTSQTQYQNTSLNQGKSQNKKGALGGPFGLQQTATIYSINGGPAFKTAPYTPARSQSPLRKRNNVYYTSNFNTISQGINNAANQGQGSNMQQAPAIQVGGNYPPQQFQIEETLYYSQSPPPNRMRHSPYMSDDEFKILHDFYDIQCEPTGLNKGGVPLMRVRRINRTNKQKGNSFGFADDSNLALPKALSSLQIFYPQYQPSPLKQELLSRTLGAPNKWFDRFYQSTRTLNQTLQNIHKQHSRKLRSYSISSFQSGEGNDTVGAAAAVAAVPGAGRISTDQQSSGYLNQQIPLFKKMNPDDIDRGNLPSRINSSLPYDTHPHSVSQDLSSNNKLQGAFKSGIGSKKASAKSGSTLMPPLNKIYNNANAGLGDQNSKKNKLPPRPKQGVTNNKHHNNLNSSLNPKEQHPNSTNINNADNQQVPRIINTNHNQYVLLGVNIIGGAQGL